MTRRSFGRTFGGVVAWFVLVIVTGIGLRYRYPEPNSIPYGCFKDLIPVLIALPSATLAFAFQRRVSYLQALRALWAVLSRAVNGAIVYTTTNTIRDDATFAKVIYDLEVAIDEVRSVRKQRREASIHRTVYVPSTKGYPQRNRNHWMRQSFVR